MLNPVLCKEKHSRILQHPGTVPVQIANGFSCKTTHCLFAVLGQQFHVDALCVVWLKVVIRDPAQDNVMKVRDIDYFPVLQPIRWAGTQPCNTQGVTED